MILKLKEILLKCLYTNANAVEYNFACNTKELNKNILQMQKRKLLVVFIKRRSITVCARAKVS